MLSDSVVHEYFSQVRESPCAKVALKMLCPYSHVCNITDVSEEVARGLEASCLRNAPSRKARERICSKNYIQPSVLAGGSSRAPSKQNRWPSRPQKPPDLGASPPPMADGDQRHTRAAMEASKAVKITGAARVIELE